MPQAAKLNQLEYRSVAGGVRTVSVAKELLAAEGLSVVGGWAKLAIGVPLCLVGPFILAVILQADIFNLQDYGARRMFVLLCIVVVPILLWLERRHRGKLMEDAVAGDTPSNYSSYAEFELRGSKYYWLFLLELALIGPRLVWSFVDWWYDRHPADAPVRLTAAELLLELYETGEGRQIADLVRPDRPKQVVYPALKYLIWHEWIDISAQQDRVWLRTPARKRLEARLNASPK